MRASSVQKYRTPGLRGNRVVFLSVVLTGGGFLEPITVASHSIIYPVGTDGSGGSPQLNERLSCVLDSNTKLAGGPEDKKGRGS